jgi:hypothetical protein
MLRARLAEDFKGAEGLKESDDGGLAGKNHGDWAISIYQWIGLRENLQESPIFNGKIYGFL